MLLGDFVKQNENIIFYTLTGLSFILNYKFFQAIFSTYSNVEEKIAFCILLSSIPFLSKLSIKITKWICSDVRIEGINRILTLLSILMPILVSIYIWPKLMTDIGDNLLFIPFYHYIFWIICAPLFWIYQGFVTDKK